jgi:hypothetical protein
VNYDKWLFHERFISGVFYGFIKPQPVCKWVKKGNKYSCLQNCPVKVRLVMQKHKLTNNSFYTLYILKKLRVTKGDINRKVPLQQHARASLHHLAVWYTTFRLTVKLLSIVGKLFSTWSASLMLRLHVDFRNLSPWPTHHHAFHVIFNYTARKTNCKL